MSEFCVHATQNCNIESIVRNGLLASTGLYHWLGYGSYGYHVCYDAPRGGLVAFNNALTFANRKYGSDVGCVLLEVITENILDLQHPAIYSSLEQFRALVTRRARDMGFRIEQNDGIFRPLWHFVIDAFILVIEALSGSRIDLVQAQFHGKDTTPVDEIITPEVCIKNPRSVISRKRIVTYSEIPRPAENNLDWLPSNAVLKAASKATDFVNELCDSEFADLVFKVAEGANNADEKNPRFRSCPRVPIVARNSGITAAELLGALTAISNANLMTNNIFQTDQLSSLSGPEELRRINELVGKSTGLIVVADAEDVSIGTVLQCAKEKKLPVLVMANKDTRLPSQTRSTQNITVLDVGSKPIVKQIEAVVSGFITDNWNGNSVEAGARLAAAARNCNKSTYNGKVEYFRVIKKLIEKAAKSRYDREQPGLFGYGDAEALKKLPSDPEAAAETLRERVGLNKPRLSVADLLKILGRVKHVSLNLNTPGFLVPPGLHGAEYMLAINANDPITRQKFTIAHEIGHVVVGASKHELSAHDEEDWCNQFATALLIPKPLVEQYAQTAIGLSSWFEFAETFGVSRTVAMRRVWQCKKILLVFATGTSRDFSPVPVATRELLAICSNAPSGETRGLLKNCAPFITRRTKSGMEVVADLSGLESSESSIPALVH